MFTCKPAPWGWPVQAPVWHNGLVAPYPDVHPPLMRQLLQHLQEWLPDLPEVLLAVAAVYFTVTRNMFIRPRQVKDGLASAVFRTSLKEQWLIQALEQLQQDPPAVLEAVSCTLQQLVQAYLSGQPWPLSGFVGNMMLQPYWQQGLQVLDAAVQLIITKPSVAAALPLDGVAEMDHHAKRPAQGCTLPEEARPLRDRRVLETLHAKCLQAKDCMQDKHGILISSSVDFGLHQLPTSAGGQSRRLYRSFTVSSSTQEVLLVDLRLRPASPIFTLLDDHGLAGCEGEECIRLQPGEEAQVTIQLNPAAMPSRMPAGLLEELLLFTFVLPAADLSLPSHGESQPLPRTAIVGRSISVGFVSHLRETLALSSVDAPPFVPAALRGLFDQQARQLWQDPPPLAPLFEPRRLLEFVREGASLAHALAHSGVPCSIDADVCTARREEAAPFLQDVHALLRALALEDLAVQAHLTTYDAFNVPLSFAVFEASSRFYSISATWPDVSSTAQRTAWRGPSLPAFSVQGMHAAGQTVLGVLGVPGLPEKKPELAFGDAVRLRLVYRPDLEYVAYTFLADAARSLCLLALPKGFLATVAALDRRKVLVHARFCQDTSACSSMASALYNTAGEWLSGQSTFKMLPAWSASYQEPRLPSDLLDSSSQLAWPTTEEVQRLAAGLQEHGAQVLNAEQRTAVASVLLGAGGPSPYALFGPPGTGKTVTLVECALQVLGREPEARLLLCAPGNYSADLLASALHAAGVPSSHVLRLVDPRWPAERVKEDVLVAGLCRLDEQLRCFTLPPPEEVAGLRVLVCTCCAAGLLTQGEYGAWRTAARQRLMFTHVMIDEAGQALLPEALIPLTLLDQMAGRALLCGDPRQLGPIVHCAPAARPGSLVTSLLERLIHAHQADQPRLASQGLAPATGMLRRNYRSHSALLALPNRLFYSQGLLPAADQQQVQPPFWAKLQEDLQDACHLPDADAFEEALHGAPAGNNDLEGDSPKQQQQQHGNGKPDCLLSDGGPEADEPDAGGQAELLAGDAAEQGSTEYVPEQAAAEDQESGSAEELEPLPPMLFYGVCGQQEREGEAPSWYNAVEAGVVVDLVSSLLKQGLANGAGVRPADVGVIATFRRQVVKLRQLLRARSLGQVRVGTVDDFQGQEARLVFISTTLSRLPRADAGRAAVLGGMWGSPQRFNVAITRARALLVAVGHPTVLMEDPHWRELLRHCAARGAYLGAGASQMEGLVRQGVSVAGRAFPDLQHHQQDSSEADAAALADSVQRMAQMALLGLGNAAKLYPDWQDLDELYAANAEEQPSRVML